jgi:hypothetical protein
MSPDAVMSVYIDKDGGCRIFVKHKVVEALHLKSGDFLRVEIMKDKKGFIATKIE